MWQTEQQSVQVRPFQTSELILVTGNRLAGRSIHLGLEIAETIKHATTNEPTPDWDIGAFRPSSDKAVQNVGSKHDGDRVETPRGLAETDSKLVHNVRDSKTAEALLALEKHLPLQDTTPVEDKSVWQTIKENPGKTALGVGGTALALGLAKYGMSRYAAAHLPRVLIFEESPFMGQAMKAALSKSGYQADLFLGARSLKNNIVGIATDGTDVAIDLSKYRFGLLAGGLKGEYHGVDIARRLASEKITTLGLSTSDKMDNAFRLSGATITSNKGTGFAALHQGVFNPTTAIKSPQKTQLALERFGVRLHEDKALRKTSDDALMEAMKKFGVGD